MSWRWLAVATISTIIAGTGIWIGSRWIPKQAKQPAAAAAVLTSGSCRLPVFSQGSKSAAFLSVPHYDLTPVAAGNLKGTSKAFNRWAYQAASASWLPVDYRMISPDGNWWMYQTPAEPSATATATIHLVDRRGTDRIIWGGKGIAQPLGWTARGAVFDHLAPGARTEEIWLIDPRSGTLRALPAPVGELAGLDATGIWGMQDRPITQSSANDQPLRWILTRTDLVTGSSVTWWDQVDRGLPVLLGFYEGNEPIVEVLGGEVPNPFFMLTAPKTELAIAPMPDLATVWFSSELTDGSVIWLGDAQGQIWKWTSADGIMPVAQMPAAGGDGPVIIAGPCR